MPRKSMYQADGVAIKPQKDFTSFVAKVAAFGISTQGSSTQYTIHIPKPIAESLQLKNTQFLEVAIRKADNDTLKEYFLPQNCPKCNKYASIDANGLVCSSCGFRQPHSRR